MPTNLSKIVDYLEETFSYGKYHDSSLNGLQVEATQTVTKIGAAVDFADSILDSAIKNKVDLLITHHGLLWGPVGPLTYDFGKKVKTLFTKKVNLVGIHLPLDAHPDFGNNVLIAKNILKLSNLEPAVELGGQKIGFKGDNHLRLDFKQLVAKVKNLKGCLKTPTTYNYGPKVPKKICVVSGAAADGLYQFRQEGFDTFITGEPRQFAYHFCKENKLNAIFAGHYGTETFGVCSISEHLSKKFGLPWTFIDEPTGV